MLVQSVEVGLFTVRRHLDRLFGAHEPSYTHLRALTLALCLLSAWLNLLGLLLFGLDNDRRYLNPNAHLVINFEALLPVGPLIERGVSCNLNKALNSGKTVLVNYSVVQTVDVVERLRQIYKAPAV